MLARSGQLPTRGVCAYEVKWDGFRWDALVTSVPRRVPGPRYADEWTNRKWSDAGIFSGPGRSRTYDQRIMSPLL